MICVSIGRTRHKMMILEHQNLAQRGAELVELRLDYLSHLPDLARLIKDRPTPVIVTIRRGEDKGRWRGDEQQRQTLLRQAIVQGVGEGGEAGHPRALGGVSGLLKGFAFLWRRGGREKKGVA